MAQFIDNSAVVLRKIGTNSKAAMEAAADMLVEAVQWKILYGYHDWHGRPPHTEIVDTGALYDSIAASVKRDSQNAYSVSVGSDRDYASYVHDGTSKLKGRPFIRDAVFDSQQELQEILGDNLRKGFNA